MIQMLNYPENLLSLVYQTANQRKVKKRSNKMMWVIRLNQQGGNQMANFTILLKKKRELRNQKAIVNTQSIYLVKKLHFYDTCSPTILFWYLFFVYHLKFYFFVDNEGRVGFQKAPDLLHISLFVFSKGLPCCFSPTLTKISKGIPCCF